MLLRLLLQRVLLMWRRRLVFVVVVPLLLLQPLILLGRNLSQGNSPRTNSPRGDSSLAAVIRRNVEPSKSPPPTAEKVIPITSMRQIVAAVAPYSTVETATQDAPRVIKYDKLQDLCQHLKHARKVPNRSHALEYAPRLCTFGACG